MKISVCIPYHNVSRFIEQCLNSVIDQSYNNYEIIIFNDGSTKEEKEKLENCINKLNLNAEIINSKNIGLYAARVNMFERASGDIIVSLDSDDYLFDNNALEAIAKNFFEANCDMVIYNNTRKNDGSLDKDFSKLSPNTENIRQNFCCDDQINNVWIKAIKADILKNITFDKSKYLNMCEDIYLTSYFFDNVKTISIINKALYFYRDNKDSLVRRNFDKQRLEDQEFVEKRLVSCAKKWGVKNFDEAKHWFEFMVYGDIYYCFLCDGNGKSSYKMIYNNNRTQKLMHKLDFDKLPKHKKIPIKLFSKQHFTLLNAYFQALQLVKRIVK